MGRWIRSDSVDHGRNHDVRYPSDKKYVRCSRCGFICNADRDISATDGSKQGYGLSYQTAFKETTITDGVITSIVTTT